ncbi:hypothetical protein OLMES_4964 [Oleiphilus messinensis]|uniref:Lipoprotein n=1 Tax=Oleiphilus messinensis TaxID=141451 RepID=A0A1Y0IEK8_9GAMM|nr:hypothetical protein [Oleiphilus messinensis]ARU58952.1 hypothetical protein OLMES_4964 [Oleiphilus messinensis]
MALFLLRPLSKALFVILFTTLVSSCGTPNRELNKYHSAHALEQVKLIHTSTIHSPYKSGYIFSKSYDVKGSEALIQVIETLPKHASNTECLPACEKRVMERRELSNFNLMGRFDLPEHAGYLLSAKLTGGTNTLVFDNQIHVIDNLTQATKIFDYAEQAKHCLQLAKPEIAISNNGQYVMVNGCIWNRDTNNWNYSLNSPINKKYSVDWAFTSNVSVGTDYFSTTPFDQDFVIIASFAHPEEAQFIEIPSLSVELSPDDKRLLVKAENHNILIDTKTGKEINRWPGSKEKQEAISWENNRIVELTSRGKQRKWGIYQIEPFQFIAGGQVAASSPPLISNSEKLTLLLDKTSGSVEIIDLETGQHLGQQTISSITQAHAWLGQSALPMVDTPLTLLFSPSPHSSIEVYGIERSTRM